MIQVNNEWVYEDLTPESTVKDIYINSLNYWKILRMVQIRRVHKMVGINVRALLEELV